MDLEIGYCHMAIYKLLPRCKRNFLWPAYSGIHGLHLPRYRVIAGHRHICKRSV